MSRAVLTAETASLANTPERFFEDMSARLGAGERLVTFYGRPGDEPGEVVLTALLDGDGGRGGRGGLSALRTAVGVERGFHSLTPNFPPAHVFEREIFEQLGAKPHGHPWLKPVRFEGKNLGATGSYPFYKIDGKEVHEVAVGPIHAGVIEPGHFRFMCLGESVHHLEVQLGYQHRAVEALLLQKDPWRLAPIVETIAGDSSVSHAWAYCDALEALSGALPSEADVVSRGVALELERVAMHLAGLAGMCQDVAFLQGAATYGRLRTTAINTSMLLCGSRFGRGWLRPGGARAALPPALAEVVRANLALLGTDIAIINAHFLKARTVDHRLRGVGILTNAQALALGVVGPTARASGVALDARSRLAVAPFAALPIEPVVEESGDCRARAVVRIREIDASLRWLGAALAAQPELAPSSAAPRALAPDTLAVARCEGWRGEVIHALETDAAGRLRHYKVQDPSLRNWFGLAVAVRNNEISDFPICNKSFDLSYCGSDL